MKTYKIIVLTVVIALVSVGCGYRLSGFGKYIPEDLKTIAIPEFENQTTEYRAEQFVTFAIRNEFIKRSAMILKDRISEADALLEGVIKTFEVEPVNYSSLGTVNMYRVDIRLNVKLINLKNSKIVFEKNGMRFVGNYEIASADFFSQESDALKKISGKFSASIVSAILENF